MDNVSSYVDNNSSSSGSIMHYGRLEFIAKRPELAIPCVVIVSFACILGTFGNSLILIAVISNRKLRSVECILIVNLALSDLFVTIIADPMSIIAKLEGEDFFIDIPSFCRAIGSLCTISCCSSLWTITAMSVNRYFLICHHNLHKKVFTKKGCIVLCMSFYIAGIFIVLLNVAGIGDHGFNQKSLECIWDRMVTYPYTVVIWGGFVLVPIILTGVLYLRVYLFVLKRKHRVKENLGQSKGQMHNLAKSLIIIYAVFAICWVPYCLLIIIDFEDKYSHAVHIYITAFAHLHPSFNWIVYYFTNKKFTAAFNDLIPIKKLRENMSTTIQSSNTGDKMLKTPSNEVITQTTKSYELLPRI